MLVLSAAAAAAIILGRALTQPLAHLVVATQAVAAGDLETELTPQREDEIGALTNVFRAMIAAVRQSQAELRAHGEELEALALERARLFDDLSQSYDRTLDALTAALDARDKETEGHSRRVVAYTLAIAGQMDLPEEDLVITRRGALLHDIGKIGVPDAILHKPGPLTNEEWAIMRRHPEWGERILAGIPFLTGPAQIVCAHHERMDGNGYPQGLAGEAIPLGARIFAVADTFDAITSDRPYRAARSYAVARSEIEAGSGGQFDPRVVEAFLQIPEEEWARQRAESLAPPGPL